MIKDDYQNMPDPPPCKDCPLELEEACAETGHECPLFERYVEKGEKQNDKIRNVS